MLEVLFRIADEIARYGSDCYTYFRPAMNYKTQYLPLCSSPLEVCYLRAISAYRHNMHCVKTITFTAGPAARRGQVCMHRRMFAQRSYSPSG